MKKFLAIFLAALMILTLGACEKKSDKDDDDVNTNNTVDDDIHIDDTVEDSSHTSGNVDDENSGLENDNAICSTHNYKDNICAKCGCSLWSGKVDTSWYSAVALEFTITNAEQFAGLINIVNNGSDLLGVKVTLANHIDMNGIPIAPIGATSKTVFAGSFDGNGRTVSNVTVNTQSVIKDVFDEITYATHISISGGLFGYVVGDVLNLNVKNLTVDIRDANPDSLVIGGIAANIEKANIENCSVQGQFTLHTSGSISVGGISASAYEGNVSQCSSNVSITANVNRDSNFTYVETQIGGVIGVSSKTTVSACSAEGNIIFESLNTNYDYVGGLIGYSSFSSHVGNCYSTVGINGKSQRGSIYTGSLIGSVERGSGSVENCYSAGDVALILNDSYAYVGGLVGYAGAATRCVSKCFTIGNVDLQVENGDSSYFGTVFGECSSVDDVSYCFYLNSPRVTGGTFVGNGSPATLNDFKNTVFYKNKMQWDSSIWNLVDGALPTLK
ncbi:MAG: hypothetical protein IJX19_04155 [Clostridia bacterium]|nr:hypothetical protein [Clostridia bacterium]